MRKYFVPGASGLLLLFIISGCATTYTPAVTQTVPAGPPPGCDVKIDLSAITFNFLKQGNPVKFRVANKLGYFYARARSDIGFNPFGGNNTYSIRYKIDEALNSTAELFGKCFNLVGEDASNVPAIEFTVTGFSGDTFMDGRISGDQNWVINENWQLNLAMRLLDANGEVVNEVSSAQTHTSQRRWSMSDYWSVNVPVVRKMLTDALNEVIPKFFADPKIRTALMASTGAVGAAKDSLTRAEEAEKNNNLKEAFNLYVQSLSEGPLNLEVVARVIGIAKVLKPMPVIPEEARKQASYGKAALDLAKDESGYFNAIQEYQKAIRLAPWWMDLYVNTALIMEKAGLYADAVEYLKLYLLAAPEGADAEKVRSRLYELEYKAKQTGR